MTQKHLGWGKRIATERADAIETWPRAEREASTMALARARELFEPCRVVECGSWCKPAPNGKGFDLYRWEIIEHEP